MAKVYCFYRTDNDGRVDLEVAVVADSFALARDTAHLHPSAVCSKLKLCGEYETADYPGALTRDDIIALIMRS